MISRKVSIKLKIHVFHSLLSQKRKRKKKKRQPHEAVNYVFFLMNNLIVATTKKGNSNIDCPCKRRGEYTMELQN